MTAGTLIALTPPRGSGHVARGPARLLAVLIATLTPVVACGEPPSSSPSERLESGAAESARERMVSEQIRSRGIRDERVLAAMRKVPRHEFVPPASRELAYEDQPLPIGHGQTISQPYVFAAMTELAALDARSRVLEVGTGSGYQAAVLAEIAREVYTIEIVEGLAREATRNLRRLGYGSVRVRHGDGYGGWKEAAPFDAIIVTAAAPVVPSALQEQLAEGGRLVIPIGDEHQELRVYRRTRRGIEMKSHFDVRFVPLTRTQP
jgi:protein-L-isoaspartate(D-aspartate) O-methyltransferase